MKNYALDDVVWLAKCGTQQVVKPCLVCHGKLQVTLVLGNGDEVILPCDYCGRGYEYPSGIISEYEYVAAPIQVTITGIEIRRDKTEYSGEGYHLDSDKIFDTKEEALAKCQLIANELEKDQSQRSEYLKHDTKKTFSWNAGYHLRAAKKCRKDAEYHESKAILCKERIKKDGGEYDKP